jgi:hypothetical protein
MNLELQANIGSFVVIDPETGETVLTNSLVFEAGSEEMVCFQTGLKAHVLEVTAFDNGGGQVQMATSRAETKEQVIIPFQVKNQETLETDIITLIG